ncbi:MAG: YifB family Mg chelatase-like AAA ATPase [Candidatus Omnitrophica bacterium]|nr:YifB family Mg chelatase-like AAA ATPase [Candidatus Omnitrophota bacterium]
MLAKINSLTIWGIEGYSVEVEVDISYGVPAVSVVGLPDQAVKESRDRIKPAIKNSGFDFPANGKIVINLAPADIKKEGSYFDLPIAAGILAAQSLLPFDRLAEFSFVGELALDGTLRPVKGILPIAIKLSELKEGRKKLIIPAENALEASIIKGIEVYPVKNLRDCMAFLTGKKKIEPAVCNVKSLFESKRKYSLDFKDVKGQAYAKRAIEVAVAGAHNIIMAGSPGAGKTMLASRMPSILPALTLPEALEITRVHSVAGILQEGLITERPFRAPHHTISDVALIGGGNIPKPGEVSLAHNGVLFLDELPEFHRDVLEVLRQPLEDGKVNISRARGRIAFPARFLMAASMNPCYCGWYGDAARQCNCTLAQILKYRKKISGPLLDRIDIHIEVSSLPSGALLKEREEEPSETIRRRVEKARAVQQKRFEGTGIFFNGHMSASQIKKYCVLDEECVRLIKTALDKMRLSARAYDKIRKVARTIADLDACEAIRPQHLAEAIQYRSLDRDIC